MKMEKFNILAAVQTLLYQHKELEPVLKKYLIDQRFNPELKNCLLNDLTIILLDDNYSVEVATLLSPILLDLLSRASDMVKDDPISKHECLCICLSKLIWNFPDVARFAKMYFEEKYGFFSRFEDELDPPSKRPKADMMAIPAHKLLKAANMLLIYDAHTFKDLCDWSVIVRFLNSEEPLTRWYAYQCILHVGNIKDHNAVLREKFNETEHLNCAAEEMRNQPWSLSQFQSFKVDNRHKLPHLKLAKPDLFEQVVNVEGVLLSKYSYGKDSVCKGKFVCVPSVQKSQYHLALAVSIAEPVLLQGPVGCGKTSIIEHLAVLTGRRPFEELLKVQLGDHMDSKMLVGTHCCTEIPGEFVWKPGILIQAMTEGHWLVLEDIDCAPMDVVSLLIPVLQERTIILPGHANPVKAAPGFQLFATQRFIRGLEGSYVEFRNNIQIIEKQFRKISMEPFSNNELKQMINAKWPRMDKISDKILEIYSLFPLDLSKDKSLRDKSIQEALNFHHGRLVSTRDLFKFCARISSFFESSKKDISISAFQNAVECFCDSIPTSEMRLAVAESIGAKINISSSKANSLFQKKISIERRENDVLIGRVSFPRTDTSDRLQMKSRPVFAHTKHSCALMEKVAVAVARKEPVLLVGETGTGKTSVVQYLAHLSQHKLTVINMSQQSDSVDLIGGYKPVDLVFAVRPIKNKFMDTFALQDIADFEQNSRYLAHIDNCFHKKRYSDAAELMSYAQKSILTSLLQRRKNLSDHLEQISIWRNLGEEISTLKHQLTQPLIFKFMEGALVRAMKNGDWLLLDEINLAEAETLECLAGVLESDDNTLFLYEKGTKEPVVRHPDFRIFACMNPATDVGKKDLPVGIRNRFTEFFVDEIDEEQDLSILVEEYLKSLTLNNQIVKNIVNFYLYIKKISTQTLSDGTGHYPHYSLRTLCRALKYASSNPCHNVPRSLYEAFCLSFLSQLDNDSHAMVSKIIGKELLGKNEKSVLKQSIPEPSGGKHSSISGYWIRSGPQEPSISENYVFTKTVTMNVHDLARIVSACQYPVLLQGDTSVGKTSLIQWLAKASGNVCVRVNNHEHTDIQEYVGTYSADAKGNLVFKEGILVEAMRKGHWIILDELNLAPTEVMEALNRVLDDNRELFIPETQTTVKAHSGFMIFATQNPPGLYGGRKLLSRAFRNRFIELHFNEIPPSELEVILHKRCRLPMSYSKLLVAVMHELQMIRRDSGVFCGKQGFITLRDLFRWGERYEKTEEPPGGLDWMQYLADEGYLLLAGRVRNLEEEKVIQETIKKYLKREVKPHLLFNLSENTSFSTRDILIRTQQYVLPEDFRNVVWTYGMRRLAVLVGKAIQYNEPVLLIGSTGSGKTTICQIYAKLFERGLASVNCHMHSESGDFLGGLRPVRDHEKKNTKLFEWVDGPLIQSMMYGNYFLADEISLADDSVLERLNSVLEPEQKILVPERSFKESDEFEITASRGFHFFATMNPGGDYGKKELSPALRNRFTEIWCPNGMSIRADVVAIVEHNIMDRLKFKKYASKYNSGFGQAIAEFLDFYSKSDAGQRTTLSIRDVLTWVEFINLAQEVSYNERMSPYEAYIHGAFVAFLDGIGSGSTSVSNEEYLLHIRQQCLEFLIHQVDDTSINLIELTIPELFNSQIENIPFNNGNRTRFGVGPFNIDCIPQMNGNWTSEYILDAITPKGNLLKILRAMQLPKPILLEGSPGVGKTSLISTLAKVTGHGLVRINLSEQTDITDLFGADLPVEGGKNGEFAWRDGPLIQAIKKGDWILLDELNLASQSVLEGLNACLDHRNEIYIPELGVTFRIDKNVSWIFCCQNPQRQGGSRKGLPQSFLNRFTQIYMKSMEESDMVFISTCTFPTIPPKAIAAMVQFNNEISRLANENTSFGKLGAPWEFNLRDIFRWCEVMIANQSDSDYNIGEYMKLIYLDRMRCQDDKNIAISIFENIIKKHKMKANHELKNRTLKLNVFENCVQVGHSLFPRKGAGQSHNKLTSIAPAQLCYLESLMKCIEMNWMAILVGPSAAGKSTIVKVLADLCGQELHVLSVNSEMDTIELLGGFEQADINRKIEFIAEDLQPILEQGILNCLLADNFVDTKKLKKILVRHRKVRQCIYSESSVQKENVSKKLTCLMEFIECLKKYLELGNSNSVLSACETALKNLMEISKSEKGFNGGKFEWVDSMLINAAKKGHWVLIDDANFCSASVLDRLNALLEPGGVLTINEQGIIDGHLRTIVPHKDFRIFLALNPKNGEISRAMRNRGIEIYIKDVVKVFSSNEEIFNVSLFAQCKGFVHNNLLLHFCNLYIKLNEKCIDADPPCLADFMSAVSLFMQMIQKHGIAKDAFEESCRAVFGQNNPTAMSIINNYLELEKQRLSDIRTDYSIPVIDLVPSSFDYRQGALYSYLKKQSCLYTLFYKDYIGKLTKCPPFPDSKERKENFAYPPPKSFTDHNLINFRNDVKRFTAVMQIVLESCPLQCIKYEKFFMEYCFQHIFPSLTNSEKDEVRPFYGVIIKYQEVIDKLFSGSLMKNLIETSMYIFKEIGFNAINYAEVPFDLRYNPHVYQKVMLLLRQEHQDSDDIEHEFISRSNRLNLLLTYRSFTFENEVYAGIPNCQNLAVYAEEVAKNPKICKRPNLLPLISLPKFIEAFTTSVLEFIEDESMPCSDNNYWELFHVLSAYKAFQQTYLMHAEKGMESQLSYLCFHFSWLLKKIQNLYQGVCSMPPTLVKYAGELEMHFAYNIPIVKFRHKCMKLLGKPSAFPDNRAAELNRQVSELYLHLDLVECLQSPKTRVDDLKIILADQKNWISCFNDAVFKSFYGKDVEAPIDQKTFAEIQKVRSQMIDRRLIAMDDDEIICEDPVIDTTMSDLDLMLHVQLLPLWDYLFVTYEAEMLSRASKHLRRNESTMNRDFYRLFLNWSSLILGLNPVHSSHIIGLCQFQFKHSLVPSLFNFLKHTRHGFSTDGLLALNFKIENDDIQKADVLNKHWNKNYTWTKQQPLLTHIFSSVLEKSGDSSLMCHFPLGSYSKKIEQIKKAQVLVWKHFDVLANTKKTFRLNSASIVVEWFKNLMNAVAKLGGLEDTELNKDDCLRLFETLQIADFVKAEDNENIFLLTFDSVHELESKLSHNIEDADLQWLTGKAYVLVGLLTSMFLMPRDKFDPAKKAETKVSYFKNCWLDLDFENNLRNWMDNITCGQSLYKDWLPEHPHIRGLIDLQHAYKKKIYSAEMKVSFRSNDEQMFTHLKKDLCQFIKNLGSPSKILAMLSTLSLEIDMKNDDDFKKYASTIKKAQNHSENMQAFVDKMLKKYHLFPDLLTPFLLGIEQVVFGLSMCCHSVPIKESLIGEPPIQKLNINEFLGRFSQFSSESWKSSLHMASSVLKISTMQEFIPILSLCKDHFPNRGQLLYKFMKSAILELINEIRFQSYHPKNKLTEIKNLLFSAFQCFYRIWNDQDEMNKKKKAEEEKLYKTVVHENELSDEEKMEKELKEMFPLYEEDFVDPSTEMDCSDTKNEQNSTFVEEDTNDHCPMVFSDAEMFEVCQLHATAVALLTNTSMNKNLFISFDEQLDIVTPFLLRHEVISSIVTALGHRLDCSFEKNLIRDQMLLCQELQKVKGQEGNEYYDIYHDSNPVQVLTINPILQELTSHVLELLKEFPRNPNLVQIVTITRRVLKFPVSNPLMKFVVGLELILEAVQLWEQNAHSKVSLRIDIEKITQKVIEFRSMELDVWKKGLQNVIRKHYVKSAKWWFFMFPLFYTDNTYAESEQAVIIKGLQQCLEDSPIGEFPARLNILHSFLQEYILQSSSKFNKCYVNILFNVYTYYEQFLPAIENEIAQIRKPIEKELKDFVKIARWNDLNFYAVKTSIEKSHRYVLKHVKAFESALQKPAKTVFVLPSKKGLESEVGCWTLDIKKNDFIYSVPKVRTEYFKKRNEQFFKKFPKYQKKMQKLAEKIAITFPVVGYVNTLNEFCGNIIEALESATIDGQKSVCTRSREKKQALLKIQNKKQMLSTLFKTLRVIGLSYRQGIMRCNEDRSSECMSIPAFDISKMKILKSDHSIKELLSKSSADTNHYLYKSLAQYTLLQRLMESPSKDLTLDIIHRIQGYGSHLLTLVSSQRTSIVKMLNDVDNFGCFLSILSTVYEKQDFAYEKNLTIIPPQQYFKESNLEISNLMVMIMLAASQFGALLECAPESSSLTKDLHPPYLDQMHLSGVFKKDAVWSSIKLALDTLNCDIKNLLHQLSELKFGENIASWDHLRTFSAICQSVQKSMQCLMNQLYEHCEPDSAMIQNLHNLYIRTCDKYNFAKVEEDAILDSQMHCDPPGNGEENSAFAKLCQKLALQVALAVQEMVVFSASVGGGEPEEGNVVPENLFTAKITDSLSKAKECLRFEKISKLIMRLKKYFIRLQNSTESLLSNDKNFRLLVNLAPLLNQYYQLVKVQVATSLGMHRTSCKFLTILLEIFTILATKGFCIPPELEEAAAKSGSTKFEDIEDGGLGEGEGTKDVSEKIESEDQLDEAMQEGQEKKENDESKDKDLKNEEQGIEMSDDFEGKLHGADENAEDSEDDDEENEDVEDLDKQMGDVEPDEAEKLDDKVWGSDSENEDDELKDDDGSGGVTENMPSELVAKDNKIKDDSDDEKGEKGKQSKDIPADQPNEEYAGEKPDPMIDAPTQEPEGVDLPENMEITDEVDKDAEGNNPEEIEEPKLDESKDEPDEENMEGEDKEGGDKEGESDKGKEDADGESKEGGNIADQEETDKPVDESDANKNEYILPTQTPTDEAQALPSSEMKKSSSDPVQTEEPMDWETGAQSGEEQHKEGLSDATNMPKADSGHEGKKSSSQLNEVSQPKHAPKLKPPGEDRSVDESTEEQNAKYRPVRDKKSNEKPSDRSEDGGETSEMYEHVSKEEESKVQAIDIATQEQAKIRTAQNQVNNVEDEEEIIELSSSDEDDEQCNKPIGETLKTGQNQKSGNKGNEESETADIPEGELVQTYTVSRGAESTFHTQNELWRSLSSKSHQPDRSRPMENVHMSDLHQSTSTSEELWRKLELPVSNLAQELCEQLRLVLEPTKMSKFKGDYRTGKRLNMRKIIPYIASQFRKDKIWLRRTKPSKRQYQIMLAMDDSSSMDYNNAKKLAFESLVVLGQSLTLLEAGELSVVKFGEEFRVLHGFHEQFSASSGDKILQKITFAQKETKIVELLEKATIQMVAARNRSHSTGSKETAQLLIIISDGRNIFREGKNNVKTAVKNARDNNIFMVFLVLDNMENKNSILDGKYSLVDANGDAISIPYMDMFPFPFYIILREISALPQVLGEALRQWFELVTSVDR